MKILIIYLFLLGVILTSAGSEMPTSWVIGWGGNVGGQATGIYPFKVSTNKQEMLAQFQNPKLRAGLGTVSIAGQPLSGVTSVTAGLSSSFAIKDDGSVARWGWTEAAQALMPTNLTDVTAIALGDSHGLALKKDGTVVGWGDNRKGAISIPANLGKVVAIAAGGDNSLALKQDGTLAGWGRNIKIPTGLSNVVAIALAPVAINHGGHGLALRADGAVVNLHWDGVEGRGNIQPGLSNVVAISSGPVHDLALRRDGTVTAWGMNGNGETDVPAGLTNVAAVAAGGLGGMYHLALGFSLALKADGQLVAWGKMGLEPPLAIPDGLSNVVAIAVGREYCLAITTNRLVAERFRIRK